MPTKSRTSQILFAALCICLFVLCSAAGQAQQATDKSKQVTNPPAASASPSEASQYAGAETCKTCHEDIYNGWEKGAHWKQTYKEGGIAKHGCED